MTAKIYSRSAPTVGPTTVSGRDIGIPRHFAPLNSSFQIAAKDVPRLVSRP
jgi:hypothetical protein